MALGYRLDYMIVAATGIATNKKRSLHAYSVIESSRLIRGLGNERYNFLFKTIS